MTNTNSKSDMTVATEILRQLGGRRFLVMTGSKNPRGDQNSLTVDLARNAARAKWLTVTLQADDTYTVTFRRMIRKTYDVVTVKEFDGVYADQLQSIFTDVTGLYTRLS